MVPEGLLHDGPAAGRYPRGKGHSTAVGNTVSLLPIGKSEIRRKGQSIALLAFGSMVTPALEAGETLNATVVNMRFVKPLDEAMILDMARTHDLLVTIEENAVPGGAGNGVNEVLNAAFVRTPLLTIGLPDRFIEQGSREEVLKDAGLDVEGLLVAIEAFTARLKSNH